MRWCNLKDSNKEQNNNGNHRKLSSKDSCIIERGMSFGCLQVLAQIVTVTVTETQNQLTIHVHVCKQNNTATTSSHILIPVLSG